MYHLSSSRGLVHLMHGMMYYAFCKYDIIYNPMTNHCSSLQTRKRNLRLDICLYVYIRRNINITRSFTGNNLWLQLFPFLVYYSFDDSYCDIFFRWQQLKLWPQSCHPNRHLSATPHVSHFLSQLFHYSYQELSVANKVHNWYIL